MVMEALDRSLRTDVYHESDPRAFRSYMMRGSPVIADLIRRSPAPVFVIKALCELQDLPGLMDRFPPANTVWIYRDYRDVANSITASFRSVPETMRRLAEEGEAAGWWGRGMSDATQAFVQRVMAREPNEHTCAAMLWFIRNRLYFDLGLDRDPRVLVIRYEALVNDPEGVLKRVSDFVGIPFEGRLAHKIHPRSIGRRPVPEMDAEVHRACEDLLASLDVAADAPLGDTVQK